MLQVLQLVLPIIYLHIGMNPAANFQPMIILEEVRFRAIEKSVSHIYFTPFERWEFLQLLTRSLSDFFHCSTLTAEKNEFYLNCGALKLYGDI